MKSYFFIFTVLGLSFSMPSQADCVEGFSPKTMSHMLFIDKGFNYNQSQLEQWKQDKLGNTFSLKSGKYDYDKHLLILKSEYVDEDENSEENLDSFICEVENGIQIVIKSNIKKDWRETYNFQCDKTVSVKTYYEGVYPLGAIAYCK